MKTLAARSFLKAVHENEDDDPELGKREQAEEKEKEKMKKMEGKKVRQGGRQEGIKRRGKRMFELAVAKGEERERKMEMEREMKAFWLFRNKMR